MTVNQLIYELLEWVAEGHGKTYVLWKTPEGLRINGYGSVETVKIGIDPEDPKPKDVIILSE